MVITLEISPEIEPELLERANAAGLSVEDYLLDLVKRDIPASSPEQAEEEGSGMVMENGLLVYRTGRPLPSQVVDDAIRRLREERSRHLLGDAH